MRRSLWLAAGVLCAAGAARADRAGAIAARVEASYVAADAAALGLDSSHTGRA